jgi:hypothetical protein
MEMSVYIDQYIGTEIFPGLPTSRRFDAHVHRAIVVIAAATLAWDRLSICHAFTFFHQVDGKNTCGGSVRRKAASYDVMRGCVVVSFMQRLEEAQAEMAQRNADPLRQKVIATVRGMDEISTHALLDLIDLPKTTGNGRRLAVTMRSLGFVPIKSRRLMPGGWRDTVTRGWARPIRAVKNSASVLNTPPVQRTGQQIGA